MDPDRHCLDEAAPPGSSLHYATLFVGPRDRAALIAVHALRHTLLRIVDTVADPEVRARKLDWWGDEVMEARDGRPRHPVAAAVTRHGGTSLWRLPEVAGVLSAVSRAATGDGLASESARDRFCMDVGGGTALLCTAVVAPAPGAGAAEDLRELGAGLERAILAGAPPSRPPRSDGPDPGAGDPPAGRRPADERARARRSLIERVHAMPRRTDPVTLVYRTLAHIQVAALAGTGRGPGRARPASITPLRKLWIAWRTMRRSG